MDFANADASFKELLAAGPSGVQAWVAAVRTGATTVPEDFNWLGLAWGAAHRARTDLSLDWARVAVDLYQHLAASADARARESLMLSAMNLRAFFIERFAPNPTDELLRLDDIVAWFRASPPLTYDQAARQAAHWEQLPIEGIRALRDIKNRLGVFETLEPDGWLDPYPDIKKWLALRDQLP